MTIAVVYVYPLVNVRAYYPMARRFARTYAQFPAGADHTLYVITNGGKPHEADQRAFEVVPDAHWLVHNNVGWDIGAFQMAAEKIKCDLLVCMGAPTHFWKEGWLEPMVEAYLENGIGYYGCWAYLLPLHIRTTVFWLPPQLLQSYPLQVAGRPSRYDFEHGRRSMTRHTLELGLPCAMVGYDGVKLYPNWSKSNGLNSSLVYDQFTHRK